jgi:uncharacterized membrane protein YfcA
VISLPGAIALLFAGAAAGLVGSAGGITSLVSYPALLAVGLPALSASIANNVALVGSWPGSALASEPELRGRAAWIWRWAAVAAAGGAAGAGLLLCTPPHLFARVVPLLVLAGSLALLLQPRLSARRQRRGSQNSTPALAVGVAALSLYNGYFGAGSGVMILTLLLVLVDRRILTSNALKNMLVGAGNLAAAAILVVSGSVIWSAALPLGLGMLAGGRVGPLVARRLPAGVLRALIVLLGVGLAVYLWLHPSR